MNSQSKFYARFFDGISTRAQAVNVSIQHGHLTVEHESTGSAIDWNVHGIFSAEKVKNKIILRHGTLENFQILESETPGFEAELLNKNPGFPRIKKQANTALYGLAGSILILLTLAALCYTLLLPWAMDKAVALFPRDMEARMGKTILASFLQGEKTDAQATKLLNNFYTNLHIKTSYKVHITVVKSDVMNAFALPGGEIVVYSAILKPMQTYPELAALLGHETGHIEHRHSLRLLARQLSASVLIASIFQDYGSLSTAIAGQAVELHQLSYSREAEEEADRFGYSSMRDNKIDPHGMIALFNHLKENAASGSSTPEFMMTHPSLDTRIKEVGKKLKEAPYSHSGESDSLVFYWRKIKTLKSW